MKNRRTVFSPSAAALAVLLALLAACDTAPKLSTGAAAPVETRNTAAMPGTGPGGVASPSATSSATPQTAVATVDLARGGAGAGAAATAATTAAMAMSAQRVVYFDFDSFAIRDDSKSIVDGYARMLTANKGKKVVVEGHTDERGGREYNLALGQKRASAVVQSLTLLGVSESQLEAVSFGKERPAEAGNDEAAWAKNRRAELKDR